MSSSSSSPSTPFLPSGSPAFTFTKDMASPFPSDWSVIREGKAIIGRPPAGEHKSSSHKTESTTVTEMTTTTTDEAVDSSSSSSTSQTDGTESSSSSSSSSSSGGVISEKKPDLGAAEHVFYNRVQIFNRDLSILVINTFTQHLLKKEFEAKELKDWERKEKAKARSLVSASEQKTELTTVTPSTTLFTPSPFPGIRIVEALGATGLRSIRYWKEIDDVQSIVVNDMDRSAVAAIRENIAKNGICDKTQCIPSHNDACTLLYQYRAPPIPSVDYPMPKRPHVVDLDPYGSAVDFLDSAVQAVEDGGLLAVTCTDKAVLCGNHSETTFYKYGVMPLKGKYIHELAVRIVLSSISSAASRYARYIVPLVSFSIDFYVRVFVRVYTSAAKVKDVASKTGMIYECMGCQSFHTQHLGRRVEQGRSLKYTIGQGPVVDRHCDVCGEGFKVGGPVWLGPLHDKDFAQAALDRLEQHKDSYTTTPRIQAMLSMAKSELDTPLYYCVPKLCQALGVTQPKIAVIRSAVMHAGYKVSQSHALPTALKTDAPNSVIWDIMRCYVRERCKDKTFEEGSLPAKIMAKEPSFQANFELIEGADLSSSATGVVKFLPNPEANWGPMARATGKRKNEEQGGRSNQNKRLKKRPCQNWFKTNTCKYGDSCKYSHVATTSTETEETETSATSQEETTSTSASASSSSSSSS